MNIFALYSANELVCLGPRVAGRKKYGNLSWGLARPVADNLHRGKYSDFSAVVLLGLIAYGCLGALPMDGRVLLMSVRSTRPTYAEHLA